MKKKKKLNIQILKIQIRKNMCVLEEISNFLFLSKGIEVIFQKMTSYSR